MISWMIRSEAALLLAHIKGRNYEMLREGRQMMNYAGPFTRDSLLICSPYAIRL